MATGPDKPKYGTDDWLKAQAAESIAYRVKTYPNEITLPLGATAEPDTCGSCRFFRRDADRPYNAMEGVCTIEMPPLKKYFKEMTYEETGETSRPAYQTKDTARCDLHKPDGRVYIVQRRVPKEQIG